MKRTARDLALIVLGIALNETIGHWWLGIWGKELLPIKIMGFEFTQSANMFAMIAWPIVLVSMAMFAWYRKRPNTGAASPPSPTAAMMR